MTLELFFFIFIFLQVQVEYRASRKFHCVSRLHCSGRERISASASRQAALSENAIKVRDRRSMLCTVHCSEALCLCRRHWLLASEGRLRQPAAAAAARGARQLVHMRAAWGARTLSRSAAEARSQPQAPRPRSLSAVGDAHHSASTAIAFRTSSVAPGKPIRTRLSPG